VFKREGEGGEGVLGRREDGWRGGEGEPATSVKPGESRRVSYTKRWRRSGRKIGQVRIRYKAGKPRRATQGDASVSGRSPSVDLARQELLTIPNDRQSIEPTRLMADLKDGGPRPHDEADKVIRPGLVIAFSHSPGSAPPPSSKNPLYREQLLTEGRFELVYCSDVTELWDELERRCVGERMVVAFHSFAVGRGFKVIDNCL
jgi:hypothetical protein